MRRIVLAVAAVLCLLPFVRLPYPPLPGLWLMAGRAYAGVFVSGPGLAVPGPSATTFVAGDTANSYPILAVESSRGGIVVHLARGSWVATAGTAHAFTLQCLAGLGFCYLAARHRRDP